MELEDSLRRMVVTDTDINTQVKENVLSNFDSFKDWVNNDAYFTTELHGGEGFEIARIPESVNKSILKDLEEALGTKVKVNYSFLRLSTKDIDSDMRIHSDTYMDSDYALVLYLTDPPEESFECGTAFWDHQKYGSKFKGTKEEYNKVLNDSSNLDKWSMKKIVQMKQNRMVVYPTSYFHSRFPFSGWGKDKTDGRVIWVVFFDKVKDG